VYNVVTVRCLRPPSLFNITSLQLT